MNQVDLTNGALVRRAMELGQAPTAEIAILRALEAFAEHQESAREAVETVNRNESLELELLRMAL